ncbi:transposase [Rhizobacter sp. Root16D2]|nr:transposase [Rhizobacter sp. Root16D2]
MRAFIDAQRGRYGVEPICRALQVAPSGYWRHAARLRHPALVPQRARRDAVLVDQVQRVHRANLQVYGACKVWRQLYREGVAVARCTVERLMRLKGLQGARRGKAVRTTTPDAKAPCPLDRVNRQFHAERPNQLWVSDFTYVARCTVERLMRLKGLQGARRGKAVRTTTPDAKAPYPLDRVNRQFHAERPNQLWVSDFTYVSTWQGMVYVASVIDVHARFIVGWRVSSSMRTDFVLDEQALYARKPERDGALIHHSDRGLQPAFNESSVGSKGDSYDNALAETINGLYKTELIHRRAPWKSKEAVELATLEWVSWFNHHRLLAPIGYIPPAEAEANYHRQLAARQTIPA